MTNLKLANTQIQQQPIQTLTIPELLTKILKFQGRQIEVDLSPIQANNTYHWFDAREINDMIYFSDKDNAHPQQLFIDKSDIIEITYIEGENIFHSVFTINLKDNQQIQLCVYEKPECCHVCQKIINLNFIENTWTVNASGGYGSHFDSRQISIKICDDCMYDIVNSQKKLH